MKSKIVLLDLSKDTNNVTKDADVILLSHGSCKLENCLILKCNFFSEKKFQFYRKKLNKILFKTSKFIKKRSNDIDPNLLEFFNLRNDKNKLYDKIYNILEIKKKIINYKNIEIITDDKSFIETYRSLKLKNIKITLVKRKTINQGLFYFLNKISKFYLKQFIFHIYIKVFLRNKNIMKKTTEACLSLFPLFFNKNKNTFYGENFLNLNFQITDETHLNNTLLENIYFAKKINSLKNTISVENYVSLLSMIKGFIISLNHIGIIYKINKNIIKIDKIDISNPLNNLLIQSVINYDKIYVYKDALKSIFKIFKIRKFHYLLFEYNFGYFLCEKIKEIAPEVEIVGYQHGIYSERLMWQDFLKNKKEKYKYFPQKIFLKFKDCIKVYRDNFKDITISKGKLKKYKREKNKNLQSRETNLVFLGLHDAYEMLNYLRNLNNDSKIFVKKHPKFKLKNKILLKKNIHFIEKIDKKYDNVYLSPTSTMTYDFLKVKKDFHIINANYSIPLNLKILDKKII